MPEQLEASVQEPSLPPRDELPVAASVPNDPPIVPGRGIPRRHDLDALRAIAMLLGIVIHVALPFAPSLWFVQDTRQSVHFHWLIDAIHGFRMPLFFIVSGFFTAMLIEKRGILRTGWQRFLRIFLPLLVGCFTICPLTTYVTTRGFQTIFPAASPGTEQNSPDAPTGERAGNNPVVGVTRYLSSLIFTGDIYTAAQAGNTDAIRKILSKDEPVDLDKPGSAYKLAPLHLAALFGQAEVVSLLADAGADVNVRSNDGGTPLHAAVFLGHADVVDVLLNHGANPHLINDRGETPRSGLGANWEITSFIANLIQVPIVREDVEAGREALEPALAAAEQATAAPADDRTIRERYRALVRHPIFSAPSCSISGFCRFSVGCAAACFWLLRLVEQSVFARSQQGRCCRRRAICGSSR